MANPFQKGNPSSEFRDWQKEAIGRAEDYNAYGRRYNHDPNKPFSGKIQQEWRNNLAVYEGGDGFYCRMMSGEYHYRIFFNADGTTESVAGKFPINGRTREQYITLIKEAFNEINVLNIGNPKLVYIHDGSEDYDRSIKTPDGDIYGKLYANPPYLRGSILCNFQDKNGNVASSTGYKNNWFWMSVSLADAYNSDDEKFKYVLKHELLHNLGLDHEFPAYSTEYRQEQKDGVNYNFYNEQINFSKLSPKYRSLSLDKDKISWMDVQYDTLRASQNGAAGWNWKIFGQVNNLPINYNEQFFYKSGNCDALLVNLTTMEYEYRTPIDYTGFFEFRLRMPSEQLRNYGILVVSPHWNHKRLAEYEGKRYDEFEPENFWWDVRENWQKGFLYYFFDNTQIAWTANRALEVGQRINDKDVNGFFIIPPTDNNIWSFKYKTYDQNSGVIALVYIHANGFAESLQDLENKTGVKNIYAYFNFKMPSVKTMFTKEKWGDFRCSSCIKKTKKKKKKLARR